MSEMKYAMMPYEHYEEAVNATKDLIGDDTPFQSHELAPKLRSVRAAQPIHNCNYLFQNGIRLEDLDIFDFSEVTSATSMFDGAGLTEIPESLNLENCTTTARMFHACNFTESPKVWNLKKATTVARMFSNCTKMTGECILDIPEATDASAIFTYCPKIQTIRLLNSGKVTNWRESFYYNTSLTTLEIDLSSMEVEPNFTNAPVKNLILHGTLSRSLNIGSLPLIAESGISVITALENFAGTDNEFTQTLTLSATAKANLEALGATAPNGATWLEYIQLKGWLYA